MPSRAFGWNVVWADPDDTTLVRARRYAEDQSHLHRIDRQSGRRHHRHRGGRENRQESRRTAGRRQHAGDALPGKPIDYGADIIVHSLTKFLGGHGNSIGGMIVDAGTFNWSREGRYPMLSQPRPQYQGIVLHETFGDFAFAIACRVLGCAISVRSVSLQRLPDPERRRDIAVAHAAPQRQRAGGRDVAFEARQGAGQLSGTAGRQIQCACEKILPKGAGAVFTFGLKGGYDARHQAGFECEAVLASGQYRRHPFAHHSPRLYHDRQLNDAQKTQAGAGVDVVRLSIGLEDKEDIIADLDQALAA